jgi:nicotinate-nucleotide adenylyltransferase
MLDPVRTGILGGTFDPIHIAHLHVGEVAMLQAGLDRVLFIPAGEPWQKTDADLSPASDRLEMTRLAVDGIDGFEVDDREVTREGPTYTIDTLLEFPDEEEVFLILGADTANGIDTWHRWEEVLARARILVVPRSGVALDLSAHSSSFLLLHTMPLEISSSAIRSAVATGDAYRFLVPAAVYDYVNANSLYAKQGSDDMVGVSHDQEDSS